MAFASDGFPPIKIDDLRRELSRLSEETLKPEFVELRSSLRSDVKEEMNHYFKEITSALSVPRASQLQRRHFLKSLSPEPDTAWPSVKSAASETIGSDVPSSIVQPIVSKSYATEIWGTQCSPESQDVEGASDVGWKGGPSPSPSGFIDSADAAKQLHRSSTHSFLRHHTRGYRAGKELRKKERADCKAIVPPSSASFMVGSPGTAPIDLPAFQEEYSVLPPSSRSSAVLDPEQMVSSSNNVVARHVPGWVDDIGSGTVHQFFSESSFRRQAQKDISPFAKSRSSRVGKLTEIDPSLAVGTQRSLVPVPEGVRASWKQVKDSTVRRLVESTEFEYYVVLLVLSNSLVIGIQTDIEARNGTNDEDLSPATKATFNVLDKAFAVLFLSELLLRLWVYRCDFFTTGTWKWNVFDFLVVALQLIEEIFAIIALITGESDSSQHGGTSFNFLRLMRILRLVRIVRLVRVLRLISELRTIVDSILGSVKSLCWTLVLLVLLMYMIGVYLTQVVADHRSSLSDSESTDPIEADLKKYYGTLIRTILSLFQSMTGGVDWDDALDPLVERISSISAVLFSMYIAFAIFAFMNIVTGVFVESAMKSAHNEQDVFIVHHARSLFQNCDRTQSGKLSWETFHAQLENPEMESYFRFIDVDVTEAEGLFRLLDMDESGEIDYEEFLDGCLRLRGAARSIDLITVMVENRKMARNLTKFSQIVENNLSIIYELLLVRNPASA